MPEGSLVANIHVLEDALGAINGLLGEPPQGDQPGTGLTGAASLSASSGDGVVQFEGSLSLQVNGLFDFDAGALTAVTDLFGSLETEIQAPPTDALAGFTTQIEQVNTVLGGDFVQQLQQALAAIESISEGIPENRTEIVSALLDQILRVLARLDGPEAQVIQAWAASLQEMHDTLMPLIEQVQDSGNPQEAVVEVFRRALERVLAVFGVPELQRLVDTLYDFAEGALPEAALTDLGNAFAGLPGVYAGVQAAAGADFPTFRQAADTAVDGLRTARQHLRPVLRVLNQVATAPLFQPGALEALLRAKLDEALGVQIQEAQLIEDPFNALFDQIDEAIEGIDLEFVRTEVLGFFETARETIETVNVDAVGEFLVEQLGTVEGVVTSLEQSVTDLLTQIEAFFDNLVAQLRALAENVGTFDPDGTFHYQFEADLRSLLETGRLTIGGDPENPGAPSVAGTLAEAQTTLDALFGQLTGLLQPVDDAIEGVRDTAVQGIDDFTAFLTGLDVPALIEQLRQKVEEILDALVDIDFGLVVDPIVAELEANADKLRDVDPEALNDLLREALKLALDVIIQIDFTATITNPLTDEIAAVKALPAQAIEALQQRYEEGLALLNTLNPAQLLDALFDAFEIIENAVAGLDLTTLLAPLDALHQTHLQDPLAALRPSTLLQPLSDGFLQLTAGLDDLSGTALIGPLDDQLDEMKAAVAAFDVTAWVDDLLAAVAKVQQDLEDVRPSGLLQPLVADFERLEAELDRFRPSVLFAPVADLAAPLLGFLETVQQDIVDALFEMFQAPLQLLERLEPEAFAEHLRGQIDVLLDALAALNLPAQYNQLKGQFFDLKGEIDAGGVQAKIDVVVALDPALQLRELIDVYNALVAALERIKAALVLPDLGDLYTTIQERLLAMLPPYARALLDPETFKRVMRLADPSRFLEELDARFEAILDRLLPIRPQDITAELDATYDTVLGLVQGLGIEESLTQVAELLNRTKGIVETIRVDFLAADIDAALDDLRAVIDALDPSVFFADLDAIHHEVELVVESTLPSTVLAGLQAPLDQVQAIVASINPRATLEAPLLAAWEALLAVLAEVDFTLILQPLVDKLDELEAEFIASLRITEDAFDGMLSAARGALGSGGVSVSVSVGG